MGLTPDTQAILLLTAPLLPSRAAGAPQPLGLRDYAEVVKVLVAQNAVPGDLLVSGSEKLLAACSAAVEEGRLRALLERGFMLAQAVERWQSRAIWVLSRADAAYPPRLKSRLGAQAPPVVYGCGERDLLDRGGLAIVGSRNVGPELLAYTEEQARRAAAAGVGIVSGGARGVDQAAMAAAVAAGGHAVGVLAERLERAVTAREDRDAILAGRLVLVSPFDPAAGFHVGQAMARNKVVYALADAALVVNADLGKGGTWSGADEQLRRWRQIPVFVRDGNPTPAGLEGLKARGAVPWPAPTSAEEFAGVFATAPATAPTADAVKDEVPGYGDGGEAAGRRQGSLF